ncbi:Rid family detoxifying hydrolase [Candidatus Zixiibacteriota bacterium]
MATQAIHTDQAPAAIGPYSQAVAISADSDTHIIFTAMQIGLDPATMEIVEGGIEAETKQVLSNLTAILNEAGGDWGNVVKAVVYLADMNDFMIFNTLYGEVVVDPPPARSAVEVASLPKGGRVGIELVAVHGTR